MRLQRRSLIPILLVGLWFFAAASQVQADTPSQQAAAEEQSRFSWHLINSLIFGLGFVYVVWKYSPAFFNARSADIQKAVKDATGLKLEADFRHSEIDRKIATLPAEIARMRAQAKIGIDLEQQRRLAETQRELRRIDSSLQAEIAVARAEGTQQIRRKAALLAVESAERQLRERAGAGLTEGLVGEFVHLVERGKN